MTFLTDDVDFPESLLDTGVTVAVPISARLSTDKISD